MLTATDCPPTGQSAVPAIVREASCPTVMTPTSAPPGQTAPGDSGVKVVDRMVPKGPVVAGIGHSFALPYRDLLIRKHDSAWRNLLDGLTLSPGLTFPFNSRSVGGRSSGAVTSGSTAVTLNFRYQIVGYWFAQGALQGYLESRKRAPWNGDFTYSFGYDDYHPYTLSLVYSNYADNRFRPAKGNPAIPFDRGVISLGWKAPAPEALARPFLIDQTLTIDCRVGLNLAPRFDKEDGTVGNWKSYASVGCRYPFTRHIFVELDTFVYDHGQQPWDPDFTYSFGLADYRSNHFSIIYANYSGNRWPGRHAAMNTGTFKDGGLYLSWNHGF